MNQIKNNIRKLLFSRLTQREIDFFYRVYYRVRYPKEMRRKCTFGSDNPDKIFYIIRPRTDGTEGLMSLFMNVVKNMYYADEQGYEPVVDFKNFHTQYDDFVEGEKNSWNFFFTQPSNVTLEEVYKSKNVILSGIDIQWYRPTVFEPMFENENLEKLHHFVFKRISFSERVLKNVQKYINEIDLKQERTLGLYLRGTDYVKIKPSGHPIQPTIQQACSAVDEYLDMYNIEKIFLVTEDHEIYESIKKQYGKMCVIVPEDSFVSNYDGKNYLSHDSCLNELGDSPYVRGLKYLTKIIMLSQCAYFIGGRTMGSWATLVFNGNCYKDKIVFDLGVYGN